MAPIPATIAATPPTPEPEIIASLIPPSTDLRKRDPGIPSVIPGRLGKDEAPVDAFVSSWEEGIFNVILVGFPGIPGSPSADFNTSNSPSGDLIPVVISVIAGRRPSGDLIPVGIPVISGGWIPAEIPGIPGSCPPVPGNENPPVAPGIRGTEFC